jgi:hypothetical protein
MNKTVFIVLILLTIVMIGAGASLYLSREPRAEVIAPPSDLADAVDIVKPLDENPLIVTESIKKSDPKERYTLNIEYPSIVLATDSRTARLVSDVIKGKVDRIANDFLREARGAAGAENIPPEITSDLTLRYSPALLTRALIAIRIDRSTYIRGAAHPDSGVHIILYDLREHALLSTANLFLSGGDYLGFLSGYTRDKLKIAFPDMTQEEFANFVIPGTEPLAENFRDVLVTPKGLTVIFNPYQVAPYARGTVTVEIPYADVESRLSTVVKDAIRQANEGTNTTVSEPSILMRD